MSDTPHGQGWWRASDGKWYPPQSQTATPYEPPPFMSPSTAPPRRSGWRTWHVVLIALSALVMGVAIGAVANAGDDLADEVAAVDDKPDTDVVGDHNEDDEETGVDEAPSTTEPRTTTTEAERRQDVEIIDKGFSSFQPEYSETTYTSWAAVLSNPNNKWIATDVQVNITFKNAAGQSVKSISDTVAAILPGQQAAVTPLGTGDDFADAVEMTIQARVGSWEDSDGPTGRFDARDVVTTFDEYGSARTNATVTSTFDQDFSDVIAATVYRDAAGEIIGGDFGFVDFIPAGGEIGVEVGGLFTVPGVAATEMFFTLSNLSLLGD